VQISLSMGTALSSCIVACITVITGKQIQVWKAQMEAIFIQISVPRRAKPIDNMLHWWTDCIQINTNADSYTRDQRVYYQTTKCIWKQTEHIVTTAIIIIILWQFIGHRNAAKVTTRASNNVRCVTVAVVQLTLWCPLLPHGQSYKASRARPG